MTSPLSEFIAAVRLAENNEEEKFLIKSEQADMRTYIRECDPDLRPRIISKMVFLSILGENVAYGQMEVLTLMSSDIFSYKRIGYMAAGVLLDESSEITVLLTHTLLKDLKSTNYRIQCLALSLLANLGTTEMCQTLATEVQRLIETDTSSVMKRAAMAALRIVKHIPELAESFKPSIQRLLKHGSHSVVIAAINLMSQIISSQPELRTQYTKYHSAFVKILRQLCLQKASREFQFSVFNDPFLQIRIMKILSLLQKPTDDLDLMLESIVTGVDIKRNTARALLFQAVETIVSTAKQPALRGLAFSQVGRLFKFKEANVLYSALSVFSRVLYSGHEIVDRTSGDSIALQRYKSLIVKCLNHRDSSIRRRALDVISALVDQNNAETLIPEVIEYIKYADSEFRIELVAKVFTAIQRFAPTPRWNFDIIHQLLIENGNYVSTDLITTFSKILIHCPSIQQYAVTRLSVSMMNHNENQPLVQVASWTIGEFAQEELDHFDNLKRLLSLPHSTSQTQGYIIIALSKLSVRFNHKEEIIEFLRQNYINDISLDIQQRVNEMISLLSNNNICNQVLSPVESKAEGEKAVIVTDTYDNQRQEESSPQIDLLDLGTPTTTESKENSALKDLLSLYDASNTTQVNQNQPVDNKSKIKPFPGSVVAFEKQDYIVYFEVRKNPQNKKQMAIRVSAFNLGNSPFNNFALKFGVPIGWSLQAQSPSSTVLEPVGGAPIVQQIMLSTQTDSPLMMKILVSYLYGSQPITENGNVNQNVFD